MRPPSQCRTVVERVDERYAQRRITLANSRVVRADPTRRVPRICFPVPYRYAITAKCPALTRFAWLSVLAAGLTIVLIFGAYLLTWLVGLLADASVPTMIWTTPVLLRAHRHYPRARLRLDPGNPAVG